MNEWWQRLNSREQRSVAMMLAVVSVFLLYTLIWQPIHENLAKSQQKLASQQQLLSWVQEKTALYQQAAKGSSRPSGSLTGIVNRTAKQHHIEVARMQPQDDELQVWIDEVPFASLLTWLAQLSDQEGLQVNAIDISQADKPGIVRVRRLQLGKS